MELVFVVFVTRLFEGAVADATASKGASGRRNGLPGASLGGKRALALDWVLKAPCKLHETRLPARVI